MGQGSKIWKNFNWKLNLLSILLYLPFLFYNFNFLSKIHFEDLSVILKSFKYLF